MYGGWTGSTHRSPRKQSRWIQPTYIASLSDGITLPCHTFYSLYHLLLRVEESTIAERLRLTADVPTPPAYQQMASIVQEELPEVSLSKCYIQSLEFLVRRLFKPPWKLVVSFPGSQKKSKPNIKQFATLQRRLQGFHLM
jgi:hypothetical protein